MSSEWKAPVVYPGEIVLFSSGPGDNQFMPAVVTNVRRDDHGTPVGGVISLSVIVDGYPRLVTKDAVHNANDPIWQDPQKSSNLLADGDSGIWKPLEVAPSAAPPDSTGDLREQFAELQSKVHGLSIKLGRLANAEPVTA